MEEMLEENTQKDKYLIFGVGEEEYGIDISVVMEIICIQEITKIPEFPNYLRGVINLRGSIIPVMDVRLRFKKDFREYNERTCIVIVEARGMSLGLIVDHVFEVATIPENDLVAKPDVHGVENQYIESIGKGEGKVKLIVDCDKLINDETEKIMINL